jgi:hypothetical protein
VDVHQIQRDLNTSARVALDAIHRSLAVCGNAERLTHGADAENASGLIEFAGAELQKMVSLLEPLWVVQIDKPKGDKANAAKAKKKDAEPAFSSAEPSPWKP